MFNPLTGQQGTLKKQIILLLIMFTLAMLAAQTFFFVVYLGTNRRNYSSQVEETSELLGKTVDDLTSRLSKIASLLTFNYNTERLFGSEALSTKLQLFRNLQRTIDSVHSSNAAIDQIVLTNLHELCLGDCTDSLLRIMPDVQSGIEAARLSDPRDVLYLQVQDPADQTNRFVRVSYKPAEAPATESFYTVIVYNISDLTRSISSVRAWLGSYFLLVGKPATAYFVGGKPSKSSPVQEDDNAGTRITGFHNSAGQIVYVRPTRELNWYIVGRLATSVIWAQIAAVQFPNLLMIGILMTLLLLEGWVIVRNITDPIAYMARFMKLLGTGDHAGRIEVKHRNEIGLLAHDINAMLEKLEEMTRHEAETRQLLFQARLAKQQAEIAAFQSQVNPHFLYNTLDCMRSMALTQNLPEIGEMASAMVHIFRYSVKQSDQVRLKDEITCIKQYLTIIQIRQSHRIQVLYELENRALVATIPKMVLQPLVENAVIHGLDHVRGVGGLTIRAHVENGPLLVLEVEDTGIGMDETRLTDIRKTLTGALSDTTDDPPTETKSIGLVNIDRRLKLTFGSEFGLQLFSGKERGVRVRLSVPFAVSALDSVIANNC